MPSKPSSLRPFCIRLATASLVVVALSSCMTTKKTTETADAAQPAAAEPDGSKGPPAKSAATASNKYVDPLVSTTSRHQQARQLPSSASPSPSSATTNAFPPAPQQPAASISGLVTQPTGVRAGSVSIFSSTPPSDASGAQATGSVPSNSGINAANGSMFTPRQPLPPVCPTDASGRPVNC